MFEWKYAGNLYAQHHYPIYGGHNSEPHSALHRQSDALYGVNRKVLTYYVLQALADKDLLSGKRVSKSEFASDTDPEPEKSFTYQVYGEDIGFRYGKQVMFADEKDVAKMLDFLEKEIKELFGEERMFTVKRSIATTEPDDVELMGQKWLKKWRAGEPLPL